MRSAIQTLGAVTATLLVAAATIHPAHAATVVRLDLPAAVAQADCVVRGRVVDRQSQWSDDGLRIYSFSRVQVVETLKGTARPEVTVRTLGGEIGRIGQMVPGAPRLTAGDEVVLLLQRDPAGKAQGTLRVVGLSQGLYRVVRGAGGTFTAVREVSQLERVELSAGTSLGVDAAPQVDSADEVELSGLLARIRALVGGVDR